jgi:cytochrome c oxidase assembly factor CtaG
VIGLWAWHLPAPYEAALGNDFLHGMEHATFLAISIPLWALAFAAPRRRRFGPAIAAFFVTAMQSAALGAVLFLASAPLYDVHVEPAYRWGVQPLHDQQLAGALMWVPPGFAYLITMIVLVWRWMAHYERTHPAHTPAPSRSESG